MPLTGEKQIDTEGEYAVSGSVVLLGFEKVEEQTLSSHLPNEYTSSAFGINARSLGWSVVSKGTIVSIEAAAPPVPEPAPTPARGFSSGFSFGFGGPEAAPPAHIGGGFSDGFDMGFR